MIDEGERFEEAFELFERPEPAWERLVGRRDRKRRNQRIAAGVVGIAVFVAAIWFVTADRPFDRTETVPGGAVTRPVSPTGGDSGTMAETRVTIRILESGHGYKIIGGVVQSTRPRRCAEDRWVVVLRQAGSRQFPQFDTPIASDRASSDGQWRTKLLEEGQEGRLYAHVMPTEFCRADTSRTDHIAIPG
jgi:hypothetical protein